ncbi:MAG: TetR/AcrR family transcriptional regulator [Oscillospiraceae bacterium]
MNKPNNAKSAASVAALKQALMELVVDKPYLQITVQELCKKAGLNRTTFYSHYSSVHDVLVALEDDLYQTVTDEILPADGDIQQLASKNTMCLVLSFIKRYESLYRMFLPELAETRVFQELTGFVRKKYIIPHYRPASSLRAEYDYRFEYCKQGTMGVLIKWVTDGCVEPEEDVASFIEHMLQLCIRKEP